MITLHTIDADCGSRLMIAAMLRHYMPPPVCYALPHAHVRLLRATLLFCAMQKRTMRAADFLPDATL